MVNNYGKHMKLEYMFFFIFFLRKIDLILMLLQIKWIWSLSEVYDIDWDKKIADLQIIDFFDKQFNLTI